MHLLQRGHSTSAASALWAQYWSLSKKKSQSRLALWGLALPFNEGRFQSATLYISLLAETFSPTFCESNTGPLLCCLYRPCYTGFVILGVIPFNRTNKQILSFAKTWMSLHFSQSQQAMSQVETAPEQCSTNTNLVFQVRLCCLVFVGFVCLLSDPPGFDPHHLLLNEAEDAPQKPANYLKWVDHQTRHWSVYSWSNNDSNWLWATAPLSSHRETFPQSCRMIVFPLLFGFLRVVPRCAVSHFNLFQAPSLHIAFNPSYDCSTSVLTPQQGLEVSCYLVTCTSLSPLPQSFSNKHL